MESQSLLQIYVSCHGDFLSLIKSIISVNSSTFSFSNSSNTDSSIEQLNNYVLIQIINQNLPFCSLGFFFTRDPIIGYSFNRNDFSCILKACDTDFLDIFFKFYSKTSLLNYSVKLLKS